LLKWENNDSLLILSMSNPRIAAPVLVNRRPQLQRRRRVRRVRRVPEVMKKICEEWTI
jgi:hypothetical protein